MTTKKDFLKKFSIYAVGNISSKLIMFLLYPIMTFYLLPEELGKFDVVLTIVMWLGALAMLNMRDGAFRFVMTDNEKVFRRVLNLFIKILLYNIVIFGIGATVVYMMGVDLYFNPYLIALFFLSFNFFEVYQQIVRGRGKTKLYVIANIISAFLIAGIAITLLKTTNLKANSLIIAYTVSKLLAALYVEVVYPILFKKREKFDDKDIDDNYSVKQILYYSLFLLPANLAIMGINNWGKLFFLYFDFDHILGIYAIVVKFSNIFLVITTIYQQTWQECAIRDYNTTNRSQYFSKYFNNYLLFLSLLVASITIGIGIFYKILIAPEYYESLPYIPFQLLTVVFLALSFFLNLAYECSFEAKRAIYSAVLATIVSFILNMIFIPLFGIKGAIVANIISSSTMFIYRLIDVRRYFILKLDKKGWLSILIFIMLFLSVILYNL
ncbi:MAG: polysaccharide biosynthesis C-terminal domain-containing protein [Bacteroidales bacterium]|nr:polysaccharide biosynthesis C-terminal domain-containing protein [Bacteroidales bacterium]